MLEFDYQKPETLDELIHTLGQDGGCIIAGGTDVIPRMRHNLIQATTVIDISRLTELSFIQQDQNQIRIGALTTHQALVDSSLVQTTNPALTSAAASVGCRQTRHRGTLGGNIGNASPAADTIPALLVFDAQVYLLGEAGKRQIGLVDFILGPGKTQLYAGEIIHSISYAPFDGAWGAAFQKLGKRNGMAIAVVSAAAAIQLDGQGHVREARLALGSVAPTVVRSPKAEAILLGQVPTPEVLKRAADAVSADISPISDIRSSAAYRQHAAKILANRALTVAFEQTRGKLS